MINRHTTSYGRVGFKQNSLSSPLPFGLPTRPCIGFKMMRAGAREETLPLLRNN